MIPSLAIKDLSQSPEPVDVLFPIIPALRDKLEHSVDHGVTESKCRGGELVDDAGINWRPFQRYTSNLFNCKSCFEMKTCTSMVSNIKESIMVCGHKYGISNPGLNRHIASPPPR